MPPIISEVDHNGSSAFELTFQFESRKLLPFRRPHEIGTSTISNKCENKRKQQDCCQRELQSSGFSKSGYYLVPSGITSVLSERPLKSADQKTERCKMLNPEYSICRDQPIAGASPLRINVLLSRVCHNRENCRKCNCAKG